MINFLRQFCTLVSVKKAGIRALSSKVIVSIIPQPHALSRFFNIWRVHKFKAGRTLSIDIPVIQTIVVSLKRF